MKTTAIRVPKDYRRLNLGLWESQAEALYTGTTLQTYANATTHTIESSLRTIQQRVIITCMLHHTLHHHTSYYVTYDVTTPRPPVWPYSYVSVDHALSRRYGRYHHPPVRLEPDHGQRCESAGNGWARGKDHCRRGHDGLRWERGLADC